jgi:flagellar basal body-associated protein FliL
MITPNNITLELLQDYVQGKLSHQDANALEQLMQNDPLLNDAVEGLQQQPSIAATKYVHEINKNLAHKLKRKRKKSLWIENHNYIIIAIILMLCICIIGYMLIMSK